MTPNRYKAMIKASGGFTSAKTRRRGDRPQPLTKEDEIALDKAWEKIQNCDGKFVRDKAVKRS